MAATLPKLPHHDGLPRMLQPAECSVDGIGAKGAAPGAGHTYHHGLDLNRGKRGQCIQDLGAAANISHRHPYVVSYGQDMKGASELPIEVGLSAQRKLRPPFSPPNTGSLCTPHCPIAPTMGS